MGPRQVPDGIGNGNRRDQDGSADIRRDHHTLSTRTSVDPDPGRQREDEVGDEGRCEKHSHLARSRVQR